MENGPSVGGCANRTIPRARHFVTRIECFVKALIIDKVSSYDVQMYVRDDGSANRKAEGGSQQLSGGAKARETPSIGNWQSIGNWLLLIEMS